MSRRFALLAAAALISGGLSAVASANPSPAAIQHRNVPACPAPPSGYAHCHAILHRAVTADGAPAPNASSPTGLWPQTVKAAYGFSTSSTAGAGKTIAIVDAYDAPNIESDLAVFSSQFNLPACTTNNGCFTKVNQTGGKNYPRVDSGWALEIALDVEWAHAIAPGAKILLVEASSASFTNLLIAEDYAKTHGANYVSNSWGAPEFSGETSYDSHFAQSGVAFFVSSGDNGTPAEYPSSSRNVVSVGGTTLAIDGTNYTETGWSDSGGGCSLYESPPSGQSTGSVNCAGKRGTPDVSLVADPNTGVSVYDSTSTGGQSGWFRVGGTSASCPMIAAASAVAASSGLAGAISGPGSVYASGFPHYDVIAGNNGAAAGTGYDLVTGVGSFNYGVARVSPGGGGGGGGGGTTSVAVHLGGATITDSPRGPGILDTVLVVDASNNPVAGASITVSIAGGGTTATGSGTTASNGTVQFKYSKGSCGTPYTTSLTAASGTSNGNPIALDSNNPSKTSSC